MLIEQTELQSALGKFFSFSIPTLIKCHALIEQNKITPSFIKGSINSTFTLSGIVSDNNTTYSCKLQCKDVGKIQTQCTCKNHTAQNPCEHVLSLFYDFYQQQLLQGSILQNTDSVATDLSAKSPRYGILLKSPQDLIYQKRSTSFFDITYEQLDGSKFVLDETSVRPFLGEISVEFIAATDENKKNILKNNQPLYFVSFSLNLQDKTLKNINVLGTELILDWDTSQLFSLPTAWSGYIKNLSSQHLLQTMDDHLACFALLSPIKHFNVESENYDLASFVDTKLAVNINEGKIRQTYFLNLYAKEENADATCPLPTLFSIFVEKNNALTVPGYIFDSSKFSLNLLKWKFTETESDGQPLKNRDATSVNTQKTLFLKTWLDHTDELNLKILNECKDKYRFELWNKLITHENFVYTCSVGNKKIYRWNIRDIVFVLSKILHTFGQQIIKKSEWSSLNQSIAFEINHHTLFKNIGDFYKDLLEINVPLYWQQNPLYQWKTTSKIQRNHHDLDWFNLSIDVNVDDLKILQNIQGSQTVQWLDGKMILLSDEQKIFSQLIKRYLPQNIEVDEDQKISIKLHRCRIFELFHLKKIGFDYLLTPEEEAMCQSLLQLDSIPEYKLPERYNGVLRPYQIDGFKWLRFLYEHHLGGCLADDMGLGKTIQTISLLQSVKSSVKKILIVCPVSILWNWQEELARFSDLSFKLYYGDQRNINEDDFLILTSYGLLKRDFDSVFKNLNFDILILDEVQQLKNFQSLGSQVSKQIRARVRFVLTGTPVENDITEFYNVLDLCVPGIWGEQKWHRKGIDEAKSVAKVLSRPFVLRRKKSQVLQELPEKTEQVVYLSFSSEEEKNYNVHLHQIQQAMLDLNNKQGVGQVLKNLLQMRQLCLWQNINHIEHSSKINFLVESVSQLLEEKHSIIIFSQFTSYLDKIQIKMKELNVGISRIDGSHSLKSRQENVQKFQSGDNPIFLISLRAGGFGLNLTKASYLFLMDPWWNPAVENQAIDRAHRIGQNKHLTVYRPIIKNSVEEKVLALQHEKKKLFDDLVNNDSDEQFAGRLTYEDFKFLLS